MDPVVPLAGLANYQEVLDLNRGTLERLPMPLLEQVEVEIHQEVTPTEMEVVTMVPKEEEEEIEIMTEVRPPQEQPQEEQVQVEEGPLAPNVLMVLEVRRAPPAPLAPQALQALLKVVVVTSFLNMEHIDQASMTFLMLKEGCLKIISTFNEKTDKRIVLKQERPRSLQRSKHLTPRSSVGLSELRIIKKKKCLIDIVNS